MKVLLFIGCALCCCQVIFAQQPVLKHNYYLKARVWQTNQPVREWYMADVTDSAVLLVQDPVKFRQSGLSATSLNYQQVDVMFLKRKGSVGRGLWKGALGGMILGGIVGAITYKKCDECWLDFGIGADIAAGAILGTGGGGIIGMIVGALSGKHFTISGNKEKFDHMRLSVLDMAYRKSSN